MQPAAERLRSALESVELRTPACTVVSNVTALPHEANPDSIASRLVEQLTSPVRWTQSCLWLSANHPGTEGAEGNNSGYHELAPGKVLSGLMRRIDKSIKVTNHDTPSE